MTAQDLLQHAHDCIAQCRALALFTEEPGRTMRTFLSAPMHDVHRNFARTLGSAGLVVAIDAAGNLRASDGGTKPVLLIGSHLDTVPDAGAFDGILGVVIAAKLAQLARPRSFQMEVVGFSEEEGVRFGFPFIGSRALTGELDPQTLARQDGHGLSVTQAITAFGLDPTQLPQAVASRSCIGFLEFHIEQGPVLESLGLPVGVVESIAGQTRKKVIFEGKAGHAGTTPMPLRRDALAGAAQWICEVERVASSTVNLVATVGKLEVSPGAPNVIPGVVQLTLDVRHPDDRVRCDAVNRIESLGREIAQHRGLAFRSESQMQQAAVAMDPELRMMLARAVERQGVAPHRMLSGAGHDAMVLARRMPAAMLFLRSPGGLSHHPDESVLPEDVAIALATGLTFLDGLEQKL